MGPRPHLSICACKTACLPLELLVTMGPRLHLWICANKTACLAPDLQVSIGSSPHLWFLHAKQRLPVQNNKSLWVPALFSGFCMQTSDFWTRLASLHRSQSSSVVLSTHNSVLSTGIKRLYGFQPSPVVLCMQSSDFSSLKTSLYWSQPSSEVFACKPATFGPQLQVLKDPRTHL